MSTNEAVLARKVNVLQAGLALIRRNYVDSSGVGRFTETDPRISQALKEDLDNIAQRLRNVEHLTRDEAFELLEAACVEYDGDGTALNFAKAVMRVREQTKHFSVFYASGGEGD